MKKAQLYEKAERMYVSGHMSFESIAEALDCSDKTIRVWATEGQWQAKRQNFMEQRKSLDERLYTVAHKIMDGIEHVTSENDLPDASSMYALVNILKIINGTRKYEDTAKAAAKANEIAERGGLTDEKLEQLEAQLKIL